MKRNLLFSILILISFFKVQAQQELKSTSVVLPQSKKEIMAQFLDDFEVFEIELKMLNDIVLNSNKTRFNLKINDDYHFGLSLSNIDIRSFAHQNGLHLFDGHDKPKEIDKSITYRGTTSDGGFVRLTIKDDFIYGIIETEKGLMVIDQLKYMLKDNSIPSNQLVLYTQEDVKETNGFCGIDDSISEKIEENFLSTHKTSTDCMILEVATDADFEYFQIYGNNSNTRILAEFNNIQGIYATTFNLEIVIVYQNVWTTINDPYNSLVPQAINNEISSVWQTTFGNVERDLVHMFTGKNLGGV